MTVMLIELSVVNPWLTWVLAKMTGFQPVYSPCAFGCTPLPIEGKQSRINA